MPSVSVQSDLIMNTARLPFINMLSASRSRFRRPVVLSLIGTAIMGAIMYPSTRLGTACLSGPDRPPWAALEYDLAGNKQCKVIEDGVQSDSPECGNFPDTSNILLVMKTGASEAYAKVPTQLLTSLKCLSDFLIFSDMEQTIAGQQVFDSLDTVLPEVKSRYEDFDLYERQKECHIDHETCNTGANVAPQGWALDRYKNIHMAEKAYVLRPNRSWYLFVDADTYVIWPTLVEWLSRLDPFQKHYLGSVAVLTGHPFAHGGSGYLVSQGAMRELFAGKSGVANKYDLAATSLCCGDALFSRAMKMETGVSVKNAWPTVKGEQPHTLAYGEEQWCQPIVTMHHIGSQGVSEFDAFERKRNFSSPMRIRDIYHQFLQDDLPKMRENWDNMSDDVYYLNATASGSGKWNMGKLETEGLSELEQRAHLSFDDCRKACRGESDCLQYRYYQGVCSTSTKIKHGHPKPLEGESDDEERWMSGWDLERIEAWVRDHDECGEDAWPKL